MQLKAIEHRRKNSYAMHTIKLLLTYYLNISVQASNLSDCRIESNRKNRFGSENRIESKLFLPELECSTTDFGADQSRTLAVWRTPGSVYWYSGTPRSHTEFNGNDDNNKDSDETNKRWTDMSKLQYEF